MKPTVLYRTTIVIWSDYSTVTVELNDLAREATDGDAFCSSQSCDFITDPAQFPATEFFDNSED